MKKDIIERNKREILRLGNIRTIENRAKEREERDN